MSTIDPSTLATQLATAYTQPTQSLLASQLTSAQAMSTALGKLQSALQTFDSALGTLSSKKSVLQYSATFSTSGIGTVSASASAQPGTYALFVEQLASAHQLAFNNLPTAPVASSGTLIVHQADGSSFNVDFTTADQDADGTLSQTEIARAINQAAGNGGKVNAMLVTVSGQTQLVVAAAATGASGQITLDTTGLAAGTLKTCLDSGTQLAAAQDAIVWLGAQGSGMKMQQASNTYTSIQGVSMTFTQAMQAGASPITLTVAADDSGTANNVRSFVDAYNTLNDVLDQLSSNGSADKQKAVLASDAGVRALRTRLATLIRQQVGGLRLMDFGVAADRNGKLSLDTAKLQKTLAAHPGGLDTVFGSTSITASSGVLGALDNYVKTWVNSTSGQIKLRKDSVQRMQDSITLRQARLEVQYSSAYQRYLRQFTQLQTLQSQMDQSTSMLAKLDS